MAKIDAGTMLSFSGGEYSDKWDFGPFNVLRDFDQKAVSDEYASQYKPKSRWDRPNEHGFVAWLAANGYVEDVPNAFNWYLGGYDFEPVIAP